MAESIGSVFIEITIDGAKFSADLKKMEADAKKAGDSIENAWAALGKKSDAMFAAQRKAAENAFKAIANSQESTVDDIIRAHVAMNEKLKKLNEEQYARQEDAAKESAAKILGIWRVAFKEIIQFGKEMFSTAWSVFKGTVGEEVAAVVQKFTHASVLIGEAFVLHAFKKIAGVVAGPLFAKISEALTKLGKAEIAERFFSAEALSKMTAFFGTWVARIGIIYAAWESLGFLIGLVTGKSYKSELANIAINEAVAVNQLREAFAMTGEQAQRYKGVLDTLGVSAKDMAEVHGKVEDAVINHKKKLDLLGIAYKNADGTMMSYRQVVHNTIVKINEYSEGKSRAAAASYLEMGSLAQLQQYLKSTPGYYEDSTASIKENADAMAHSNLVRQAEIKQREKSIESGKKVVESTSAEEKKRLEYVKNYKKASDELTAATKYERGAENWRKKTVEDYKKATEDLTAAGRDYTEGEKRRKEAVEGYSKATEDMAGKTLEVVPAITAVGRAAAEAEERQRAYNNVVSLESDKVMSDYQTAMTKFKDSQTVLGKAIAKVWADTVLPVFTRLAEWFTDDWTTAVNAFRYTAALVVTIGLTIYEIFNSIWEALKMFFKNLWTMVTSVGSILWKAFVSSFTGEVDETIKTEWDNMWKSLSDSPQKYLLKVEASVKKSMEHIKLIWGDEAGLALFGEKYTTTRQPAGKSDLDPTGKKAWETPAKDKDKKEEAEKSFTEAFRLRMQAARDAFQTEITYAHELENILKRAGESQIIINQKVYDKRLAGLDNFYFAQKKAINEGVLNETKKVEFLKNLDSNYLRQLAQFRIQKEQADYEANKAEINAKAELYKTINKYSEEALVAERAAIEERYRLAKMKVGPDQYAIVEKARQEALTQLNEKHQKERATAALAAIELINKYSEEGLNIRKGLWEIEARDTVKALEAIGVTWISIQDIVTEKTQQEVEKRRDALNAVVGKIAPSIIDTEQFKKDIKTIQELFEGGVIDVSEQQEIFNALWKTFETKGEKSIRELRDSLDELGKWDSKGNFGDVFLDNIHKVSMALRELQDLYRKLENERFKLTSDTEAKKLDIQMQGFYNTRKALDVEIAQETLAAAQKKLATVEAAEANAKAVEGISKVVDSTKLQNFEVVTSLGLYSQQIKKSDEVAEAQMNLQKAQQSLTVSRGELALMQKRAATLELEQIGAQVGQWRNLFGTISQGFKEGSKEREAFHHLEMAFAYAEMAIQVTKMVQQVAGIFAITAAKQGEAVASTAAGIASQASGDPYTAFARVAAMAAILIGVLGAAGIAFGGGGGTAAPPPPKSTVLGAAPGTGSESVSKVYDLLEDTYELEYYELHGIHDEMRDLNKNITGLVSSLYRTGTFEGFKTEFPKMEITDTGALAAKKFNEQFQAGVGGWEHGLFEKISEGQFEENMAKFFTSVFGGATKAVSSDFGLAVDKITIAALKAGDAVESWAWQTVQFKKEGGVFKSSKYWTETYTKPVSEQVAFLITSVFRNMGNTLVDMAEQLGTSVEEAMAYEFPAAKISLQGLDAEGINKKLTEFFSAVGDTAVEKLFGSLIKGYQLVGEGLMETAARLIIDKAVVLSILEKTGKEITTRLTTSMVKDVKTTADLTYGQVGAAGYMARYPDIAEFNAAHPRAATTAERHWEEFGKAEGREWYDTLDDLVAAGKVTIDTFGNLLLDGLTYIKDAEGEWYRMRQITTADIIAISESLVEFAGSLENLQEYFGKYYDAFYSDTEKLIDTQETLSKIMTDLNLTLPATREGYRALVDAANLLEEDGREAFVTLLEASEMADNYYKMLEDLQSSYFDKFYSDTEKLLKMWDDLVSTFVDLDLTGITGFIESINTVQDSIQQGTSMVDPNINVMPATGDESSTEALTKSFPRTREEFRLFADAIDRTTEAGNNAYYAFIGLTEAANEFYSSLESLQSSYYDAFFSDAEKQVKVQSDLTTGLADLGFVLPSARAGFRQLIDGIDQGTEAGFKLYLALLSLTGLADEFYSTVEDAAKIEVPEIGAPMVPIVVPISEAENALKRAWDAIKDSANASYEAEQKALEASKKRIKTEADAARTEIEARKDDFDKTHEANLERLNALLDTARDEVSRITDEVNRLTSARESMRLEDEKFQYSMYITAREQLRIAVARAEGGQKFELSDKALETLTEDNSKYYKTATDYQRAYWSTYHALAVLEKSTTKELTAAEQTVVSLETQIENAKTQHEELIATLDFQINQSKIAEEMALSALDVQIEQSKIAQAETMAAMDKQLNVLLGIDDSVMSVADAITQLRLSQATAAIAGQTPYVPTTAPTFTNPAYATQLETMGSPEKYAAAIMEKYMADTALSYPDAAKAFLAEHPEYFPSYAKILSQYTGIGGGSAYAAQIVDVYRSGRNLTNPAEAAAFMTAHPELFKQFFAPTDDELSGIPKYATGGAHTGGWRVVGERGPELEYTKPSRIFSASDSSDLLRTSELVAEIKALRSDLRAGNYVVAKNTSKFAKIVERWDGDGLPDTRTTA